MKSRGIAKCAGALLALGVLSACGGGSTAGPASGSQRVEYVDGMAVVDGRPVTAARPHLSALPRYATLVPDRIPEAGTKHFEYIINDYGSYASIFDYPRSIKQIGSVRNVGGQGCTNVRSGYGNKTFWIVAGDDQITKFRVPHKKLRVLPAENAGMASSCATNAAGDLAVGILTPEQSDTVLIYPHSKPPYAAYATALSREYFDGYDDKGNLFADGFTPTSGFGLVELPAGGKAFQTITTSNTVEFPGSVQWDGRYLVITDQQASAMYRYTIKGTRAVLKGTVRLSGASDCAQTWIVPDLVYCADAGTNDGEVFHYPRGGSPIAVFEGDFDLPLGTVAAQI